jgi:serine/threonine protein kinase
LRVSRSGATIRKEAQTAEDRVRLRHESQVLAAAHHPGIVEVLDAQPDHIVLRPVEGGTLADRGRLAPTEVAALGAAIATTLADLHDLGVVHGQVAASHVLLEPDGRPVLCGFGRGRWPGQPDGPSPADDVAALGKMLTSQLSAGPTGALSGVLAQAGHTRPGRRPTARRLARTLSALATDEPRRDRPRNRTDEPTAGAVSCRTSRRVVQFIAAGAAGALVLGLGLARPGPPSPRYRVGVPGDRVVVGRWRCSGVARPAVLRPSTGDVWAFDGRPRLVATVPGATTLRVVAAAPGCDRLVVLRSSGLPVTLDVG